MRFLPEVYPKDSCVRRSLEILVRLGSHAKLHSTQITSLTFAACSGKMTIMKYAIVVRGTTRRLNGVWESKATTLAEARKDAAGWASWVKESLAGDGIGINEFHNPYIAVVKASDEKNEALYEISLKG